MRWWLALLLVIAGCSRETPDATGATLPRIDAGSVTVSGLSGGAFMATQFHVAHSSLVSGVALIAGGPYYCAAGSLTRALDVCLKGGNFEIPGLSHYAREEAARGTIDTLNHLAGARVWLFHGSADSAMVPDVTFAAQLFYEEFVTRGSIRFVDTVAAGHGWPTLAAGNECETLAPPFLNACDYDAAGELLQFVTGRSGKRAAPSGTLQPFDQTPFAATGLADEGFIYVPAHCRERSDCSLHIALHGCEQGADRVGDSFARAAGLNEWADSLDLVVLYPQVRATPLAPVNPLGCWDWWGYSGSAYATRDGAQIRALRSMVDALAAAHGT